jgi:tetratricopeptide (TPR) repeat protein
VDFYQPFTMSYFSWSLVTILIGANTFALQPLAVSKSTVEIGRIAKVITVEIKQVGTSTVGSGILLQKQGAVYTVLTAGHVVLDSRAVFNLKTSDGQVHQAITGSVRSSGNNIDLAVLKFRSNNNYVVAKIGTSNSLEIGMQIYVAGFPKPTKTIESGTFNFTKGEVIGIANKGNNQGYSLIYSNVTFKGMSGGPVLNDAGELVAIHGQGDRDDENVSASGIGEKTGRNLGIVVERFGTVALSMGVQLDQSVAALPQNQTLNAADYLLRGKYKEEKLNDYQGALTDYNQAITINPRYSEAYVSRAFLKHNKFNDGQGALADLDQAIALNPRNALYYYNRSFLKGQLGDSPGEIADCEQSLAIEYSEEAAINCAVTKENSGDFQGALADYNRLISIYPKFGAAYESRADLKYKLNDFQGALADYNQAILLVSESFLASSYHGRGKLKHYKFNNFQGALLDYDRAIAVDPKYYRSYEAYGDRGWLKYQKLNDYQGALADLNRAITINPEYSIGYYRRALIKKNKLNDQTGAVQDFRQAERLFRKQGKVQSLQKVIEQLRLLGVSE